MKARILTYDDRFAPGCCDGENGKIVPITIVPDRDNPNYQSHVVGYAKISATADGVDAEITVNDGMLGDEFKHMISDDGTYILDPFLFKIEGVLNGVCTKCRILEVSIISREDVKNDD